MSTEGQGHTPGSGSPSGTSVHERVKAFFIEEGIPHDSRIVVGVSGGCDSLTLAHILDELCFRTHVIHVNYKQRGEDSEADEQLVKDWCLSRNIPFEVFHYDPEGQEGNFQELARAFRYGIFQEAIEKGHGQYIATGHHLDDALETLLLNLGRGTGLMGLRGILPVRDNLIRPLIGIPKKEIWDYAQEQGIPWREDTSNQSHKYRRNIIRHKVVPALEEADFRFRKSLPKTLHNLQEEARYLQFNVQRDLSSIVRDQGGFHEVLWSDLLRQEFPELLLHHFLQRFQLSGVHEVLALREAQPGQYLDRGRWWIMATRNGFAIVDSEPPDSAEILIERDQTQLLDPIRLKFERSVLQSGQEPPRDENQVWLDLDKLQFPLRLRVWKEGDRFVPLGMKGSKKLSDYLTDAKIPTPIKRHVRVLVSGEDIVWVVGHRIDERYKVGEQTKKIYFVRLLKGS
ncbi:MAG: tRNA lysidine(34) synthetase TilS [Bacteroidota bacterium]|nr:tRNA lysidine(34) synthetase TilS [Bacteroidota bacterium]MDX5446767.1 tRNA lysidine(34) synthetase TilS [Bacteroidota bacterium]